ncbi:DUF3199 family protein [uncultured Clostridium sp.]|jgi:hypothetical protein|uniref:protein YqbG n=1 Tax=uncultured Clostridium sp. TaxID=59620 RepID=UPI002601C873|nr:DUF3199 family protein [uncultured Clostridium sp.]
MSLATVMEIKDYTEFDVVKERCDNKKILHDILKAESEIFTVCGHKFEEYESIPEEVKLVCIELTEYYALIAVDESIAKGYTSEKIGDYSYSMNSNGTLKKPVYLNLLKDYIKNDTSAISTRVKFRMRAI